MVLKLNTVNIGTVWIEWVTLNKSWDTPLFSYSNTNMITCCNHAWYIFSKYNGHNIIQSELQYNCTSNHRVIHMFTEWGYCSDPQTLKRRQSNKSLTISQNQFLIGVYHGISDRKIRKGNIDLTNNYDR